MTTSTSKLYGYLKGFESACFTGSSIRDVAESFRQLLSDESSTSYNTGNHQLTVAQIERLTTDISKFLSKFYRRISNGSPDSYYREQAEKAKESSKELSKLQSLLLGGVNNPLSQLAVCPINSREICSIIAVSEGKCPYYMGHKFCLLMDPLADEDVESEIFCFRLPEYKYLALAMIRLSAILITNGIDINNLIDYRQFFELILSISKIFELMNPAGETRQEYLNSAQELLTREHIDYDNDDYNHYSKILYSVFDDIKEGRKAYIKDMSQSLIKNWDYLHSEYNHEADAYYSMKSSAQSIYTGYKYSLVSSLLEVDQYKDLFQEFDNKVKYNSPYSSTIIDPERKTPKIKVMKGSEEIYPDSMSVRTILINNPGKFKPRIIHIGDNPLQDRCNYIHRRLQKLLDDLKCDCTRDQEIGRRFLQNLTLEWFMTPNVGDKKGVYGADFSNATDTLDQNFQREVLNFVMGPEVANFWTTVSSLPKYIVDIEGNYHYYTQSCGQPQGLLGSFVAFALAHHFIFLMDMKILGLEEFSATEFYRVLGDDSIYNSIVPEIDQYDDSSWIDSEGIRRSLTEQVHLQICEKFAGFIVNYDKSESIHLDSQEAKLDFAKVTYRNGLLSTPIPFRLAMKYSKSENAQLAVAIWKSDRGDPNARIFLDGILHRFNPEAIDIIKSGTVPFLEAFKDPTIKYSESYLSRLRYCISLTYLTATLAFTTLSDSSRDLSDEITFDKILTDFFSKKSRVFAESFEERIDSVNPNHKFFTILSKNEEILRLYKEIYELEDQDDKLLALATSSLGESITGDFFDCLYDLAQTSKILRLAKANPDSDISTVFPDFDRNYFGKLKLLSNKLITRGIAKKPSEEVFVLQKIIDLMGDLDTILGIIPRTL